MLDEGGQLVRPVARFGPGQRGALTRYLTGLAAAAGQPLLAVLESTNGVLDGTLLAAGLPVYRADPWPLPAGRCSARSRRARWPRRPGVT